VTASSQSTDTVDTRALSGPGIDGPILIASSESAVRLERVDETRRTPLNDYAALLRDRGIVEVERVIGVPRKGGVDVYTVTDEADSTVRRRIYDVQWQVLGEYPDHGLAFVVVRRHGRPLEDVITISGRRIDLSVRGSYALGTTAYGTGGAQSSVTSAY